MRAGTPERCRRCDYGRPVTVGEEHEIMFACTYRTVNGQSRGCPAGDECDKFTKTQYRKNRI